MSSTAVVYEQVVKAFHRSVIENRHQFENFPVITLTDTDTETPMAPSTIDASYDLILTIGSEAAERVLITQTRLPVLSILLPKLVYQDLLTLKKPNITVNRAGMRTAIYIDQPIQRQLALAKLINTGGEFTVFGYSDAEYRADADYCGVVGAHQAQLKVSLVDSHVSVKRIAAILDKTTIAIAAPQFVKQHSDNAKWLLYTAYQRNIPVIGYSEAFVNAGAIAAVYSSAEDITRHAVEVIDQLFHTSNPLLGVGDYPKYYRVSVNQRVAYSLGYRNLSESGLRERLVEYETACDEMIEQNNRTPRRQVTEFKEDNVRR